MLTLFLKTAAFVVVRFSAAPCVCTVCYSVTSINAYDTASIARYYNGRLAAVVRQWITITAQQAASNVGVQCAWRRSVSVWPAKSTSQVKQDQLSQR